jgi:hypothetical protein
MLPLYCLHCSLDASSGYVETNKAAEQFASHHPANWKAGVTANVPKSPLIPESAKWHYT